MSSSEESSVYTYRFSDKITIENADRLIAEIGPHVDSANIRKIIFDLVNVRECSSYGLRLFLIFLRRAEDSGKQIVFYRPAPVLMDLFTTTNMDHVFTIVDSLD